MKICLLGDTHFGARNDHAAFHNHFEKFYTETLFPYLEENNIDTIVQFGDLFDRRKYINFLTLYRSREFFFEVAKRKGIDVHVFVGNHDTFFKNTNQVNSPQLLLGEYDNIKTYSTHQEILFDGIKIALIPWICSDNEADIMKFVKETDAQILFGHLELKGFEMDRGVYSEHGMDASVFDKFDIVCSGHYHHKSSRGNIHYLGTPYELTWADYDDPRGFFIFDTDTRDLKFIKNPFTIFKMIDYDDKNKNMDDVLDIYFDEFADNYVKVIVKNKTNPYWFDLFINKLEAAGAIDIQVIGDYVELHMTDEDVADEAEDTLTILRKAVTNIEAGVENIELDKFLTSLYTEALYVE